MKPIDSSERSLLTAPSRPVAAPSPASNSPYGVPSPWTPSPNGASNAPAWPSVSVAVPGDLQPTRNVPPATQPPTIGPRPVAEPVLTRDAPDGRPVFESHSAAPNPGPFPTSPAPDNKSNLRYDGRTFDDWQNAWRTELSTEKRGEAVKAIAAFARAGYGKEAVDAILDVAGEYDFRILEGGSEPEGKLKDTILEELTPESRTQILATRSLTNIVDRMGKEPKKWKPLAQFLLLRLRTDDGDALKALRNLSGLKESPIRVEALAALIRNSPRDKYGNLDIDEPTLKIIDEVLSSKDKGSVLSILPLMLETRMPTAGLDGGNVVKVHRIKSPAAEKLLFDSDLDISLQARRLLKYYDEKSAEKLVPELLSAIQDNKRKAEHIPALRALAALGTKAKVAAPDLMKILAATDDDQTYLAAAVALVKVRGVPVSFVDFDHQLQALMQGDDSVREQILLQFPGRGGDPRIMGVEENTRLQQEEMRIVPQEISGGGGGGFF